MRDNFVLNWLSMAFVLVLLIFAFQPLVWVRTVRWVNRQIEWCQRAKVMTRVRRCESQCWMAGLHYDSWRDFSVGSWTDDEPLVKATIIRRTLSLGLFFVRLDVQLRTVRHYEV